MNVCLPRGSTEWHYRDLAQHRTISDGIWRKIPRYSLNTPIILLVNRQVSVEAIIELKKQPLIIDSALVNAMQKFSLTIAHLIPFRALKKIEHLHFESTVDAYYVLWGGSDLTADINQGYVRRGASFPGILKAHEMSPPNRKEEKRRHVDTYPEGNYDLRRVSMYEASDAPATLHLDDQTVASTIRSQHEQSLTLNREKDSSISSVAELTRVRLCFISSQRMASDRKVLLGSSTHMERITVVLGHDVITNGECQKRPTSMNCRISNGVKIHNIGETLERKLQQEKGNVELRALGQSRWVIL